MYTRKIDMMVHSKADNERILDLFSSYMKKAFQFEQGDNTIPGIQQGYTSHFLPQNYMTSEIDGNNNYFSLNFLAMLNFSSNFREETG